MIERAYAGWFAPEATYHYFESLQAICRRTRVSKHPKSGYLFQVPMGKNPCAICRQSLFKRMRDD